MPRRGAASRRARQRVFERERGRLRTGDSPQNPRHTPRGARPYQLHSRSNANRTASHLAALFELRNGLSSVRPAVPELTWHNAYRAAISCLLVGRGGDRRAASREEGAAPRAPHRPKSKRRNDRRRDPPCPPTPPRASAAHAAIGARAGLGRGRARVRRGRLERRRLRRARSRDRGRRRRRTEMEGGKARWSFVVRDCLPGVVASKEGGVAARDHIPPPRYPIAGAKWRTQRCPRRVDRAAPRMKDQL